MDSAPTPSQLSTSILPPWFWTIPSDMARPRPVPAPNTLGGEEGVVDRFHQSLAGGSTVRSSCPRTRYLVPTTRPIVLVDGCDRTTRVSQISKLPQRNFLGRSLNIWHCGCCVLFVRDATRCPSDDTTTTGTRHQKGGKMTRQGIAASVLVVVGLVLCGTAQSNSARATDGGGRRSDCNVHPQIPILRSSQAYPHEAEAGLIKARRTNRGSP